MSCGCRGFGGARARRGAETALQVPFLGGPGGWANPSRDVGEEQSSGRERACGRLGGTDTVTLDWEDGPGHVDPGRTG